MPDKQARNQEWVVANEKGGVYSWDAAAVAVLMDIRRELRQLNELLGCPNFTGIPKVLTTIARNTTKKKKKARSR